MYEKWKTTHFDFPFLFYVLSSYIGEDSSNIWFTLKTCSTFLCSPSQCLWTRDCNWRREHWRLFSGFWKWLRPDSLVHSTRKLERANKSQEQQKWIFRRCVIRNIRNKVDGKVFFFFILWNFSFTANADTPTATCESREWIWDFPPPPLLTFHIVGGNILNV